MNELPWIRSARSCLGVREVKGFRHNPIIVGFCVGVDARGRLLILGGNQGDMVSIFPFNRARVTGYRRVPYAGARPVLPVVADSRLSSVDEA